MAKIPNDIDGTLTLLAENNYVADRSLATALYLALSLQKPLFLEGEAGVGKTTLAQIIANTTQCHFVSLSAISAGVKDIKDVINIAKAEVTHCRKGDFLI